ncbi:6-carboxytetrahydropterin synthase [Alicycliphilus denitrificans]|uniref:6-carboxytetrahydropterin synthase n=1 Tax=Alicycliphilus denitrificans TaxID=179636 RepID=UPI00384EB78C
MTATTSTLEILHAARARFEAARQIDMLPDGHRCRGMHGHGFAATAYAGIPVDWAPYPGGEVNALQQQLDRCASMLSYGVLNQQLAQPTDENLARWIRDRLEVPGIDRVAVQSTPHQGVEIDGRDHAHIWRRYRFQAAHRLPHVPPGHKCGRLHGHGFEVILHASQNLAGTAERIDYDHLDSLWAPIAAQVNYHYLNEIPGLENPTSEMLSSWLWAQLKPQLPTLSWVTVYETASCGATFDGTDYRIWKDFTIDSAVRHRHAPANEPRSAIHGHTYTLRLHLSAPIHQVMGWTVDFGDVKAVFDPIFKSLDHHPLHEQPELADGDTTTIARWLHATTRRQLPQLARVDVFESEGGGSLVGGHLNGPVLPV